MTDTPRRTILVLAYSISPDRGSEYAVGWNYVTHMARDNDLIVLYGLAGDHMGDIDEMAGAEARFGGRVTFVPVLPDRRAQIANHLNRTGHVPFSFYLAYRYWHQSALATAQRILAERQVDIVHYLCPIGYREPGYLWKLDRPYIWGPIGGMNMRPVRPFFDLSFASGIRTAARNAANWIQFRTSLRLKRAIARTDLLIANTTENRNLIFKVHGRQCELLPENAIVRQSGPHRPQVPGDPLKLLWVGRIDQAKALEILIEALAKVNRQDWQLTVIGDGPRREAVHALAAEKGLNERIHWLGKIDHDAVAAHFAASDVHILTSLAEAHSTVLWEAMSSGVPTIAIDHCGMHDSICDACGIRVPTGDLATLIDGFVAALDQLLGDRDRVQRLSTNTVSCAHANSWDRRIAFWNDAYARAVAAYERRCRP